jgi:predicted acylesterase/phospholipase RssA
MWEIDRVRKNLELSLACYRRSYERALERKTIPDILADGSYDAGAFGGANVIYLCSLLACEVPAEIDASYHADRQAEAGRVRRQLAADLPALQALRPADWWIAATLLDAYLGLSYADPQWEEAALKQARAVAKLAPSAWEKQSTGSQLLSAARLEKQLRPEQAARIDKLSKRIVAEAFRGGVDYRGAEFDGKLGLALSGGGFRASFFHIGVLARLAELDLLRHVEVISCVSGGSIVGAHYYLLLRRLLQTTPDGRIEHGHYLKIVEDLLDQFLAGVQKNIRMRVAASWLANLRMILQPNTYSRSQRLGYLYEKYLYAQVVDGEEKHKRWLNDAFIVPRRDDETWDDSFSPKLENWLRAAKVPVLALNATALNTGRNWQFTASWMGEPLSYGSGVDSTERLEPVYYSEAQELRQFRFGDAVAASSCVPALFAPIVVAGLYEERIVRLVDGGVHDNQGTRALLDQDCDAVVVSDASGQMSSEKNPPHGALGVLLRTNSVLQARVRVAQHQELQVRERTNLVRKCAFLHLRKSVESLPVAAIGAHVASEADSAAAARLPEITDYGVNRQVQIALASLRTDLDSFTDREALALMYSGYAMADKYLGEFASGAGVTRHNWRFLALHAPMQGKPAPGLDHEKFVGHLKVGSRLAFKVWFLHPALKALGIVLIVAAAVAIAWALVDLMHAQVRIPLDVSGMARKALYFLAGALVVAAIPAALRFKKPIDQAMHPATVVRKLLIGVAMAIAGWLVCRIHLWIFDRLFLALGRVKEARPAASVRGGTSP